MEGWYITYIYTYIYIYMNLHNQSCLTYLEGYNVFTLLFPCQVNISKFACVILNKERTWSWETALSTNGVCMFFISLSNMKGSPKNSHKRQRAKIRARLEIWSVCMQNWQETNLFQAACQYQSRPMTNRSC